jgi:histone deacetylase 6
MIPIPEEGDRAKEVRSLANTCPVGYVYDPQMMIHTSMVHPHPEEPLRICKIYQILVKEGCIARMGEVQGRQVTKEEAMLVHTDVVWNKVENFACVFSSA